MGRCGTKVTHETLSKELQCKDMKYSIY